MLIRWKALADRRREMDQGEYWESDFSEALSQEKGDVWRGQEENSRDRRPWTDALPLFNLPPSSCFLIFDQTLAQSYSHSFSSEWFSLTLKLWTLFAFTSWDWNDFGRSEEARRVPLVLGGRFHGWLWSWGRTSSRILDLSGSGCSLQSCPGSWAQAPPEL